MNALLAAAATSVEHADAPPAVVVAVVAIALGTAGILAALSTLDERGGFRRKGPRR